MVTIQNLEKRVALIETRNKRVETDKAWETSWTRKISIALFTYLAIGLYMYAIGIVPWWLHAIIPTVGFLLSTLTLPLVKDIWSKYWYR